MKSVRRRTTQDVLGRGFTLVELLVVVSIIALLIAILLPSLKGARDQAKATQCGTNLHHVGQAMAMYTAEYAGFYPPSYVYPKDPGGNYDLRNQDIAKPYGYLHWSWYLYSNGKVNDDAFVCPTYTNGGAPRTNPGPNARDWELGEQDDQNANGIPHPDALRDKQAPRMPYAANAAIVPRNKFTQLLSEGPRTNHLVPETTIKRPGGTILATEYINNWKAIIKCGASGTNPESRSHRPINPFYHIAASYNEYRAMGPGFVYGLNTNDPAYGLMPYSQALKKDGILDWECSVYQPNAVGRHHPGGNKYMGGTANFLFVDTHVERTTVLETLKQRLWGDRYYSLDKFTEVLNMRPSNTTGH